MKIILDTHIFLWALSEPEKISPEKTFEFLDFNAKDAVLLKDMPFHHKDPFDRMLIAQSLANKFHIMSDDRKFKLYDCKLL